MNTFFTYFYIAGLSLMCFPMTATALNEISQNFWFENHRTYRETLEIPDAYEVEVRITGYTGKVKVFLYNEENQSVLLAPLKGEIDWNHIIQGNTVTIAFKTGARVIDEKLTVTLTKRDSHQIYNEIKQKLTLITQKILEINEVETKTVLEQHIIQLTQLSDKINQTQEVKSLVPEAVEQMLRLVKMYHRLIAKHAAVTRSHQQELEEIRLLKQQVKHHLQQAQNNVQRFITTEVQKNEVDLSKMYATEQDLWEKLVTQVTELEIQLTQFSANIVALLETLAKQAQIYQKTADLVLMSETVWALLTSFTQTSKIAQLSQEIIQQQEAIKQLLP